jgi:hypothetical protein
MIYVEVNPSQIHILCREVVEEHNFAGHFWGLQSSILSVISSVGF